MYEGTLNGKIVATSKEHPKFYYMLKGMEYEIQSYSRLWVEVVTRN